MADGGQQLGKYRILEELGAGGFATVYKAVDTTLDREVALKILHPPLLADRRFVQNFRLEARTLAAMRHPHIITVYEVGEVDGRLFIAMDLAHGLSLAKSIAERGRIPWGETLALLKPVSEALDYAHGKTVVHRDLKPANILLDERGALLTDFGFARLMAESSASMSMSGGIVGTPGYIAPEVWELNAADPPVDIYALGCIVYEMLTGDVLFKGQTPMQALRAHDRGPQFAATWPEDVPATITSVLSKALAREPAARYPSAGALWHALNDLEAQAHAAREVEQRAALAAQWRAEAERAMEAKEWDAARMAIGHWHAITPNDPALQAAQAALGRQEQAAREAAQRQALAAQYRAEAERALAMRDVALARKAIENWRTVAPDDPALQAAQAALGRQERAAREAAQSRAEAERAIDAKEWERARIAIGRWRDLAPDDAAIGEVQKRLERLSAPPPIETKPSPSPQPKPAAQEPMRKEAASVAQITSSASKQPPAEPPTRQAAQPQTSLAPQSSNWTKIFGGLVAFSLVISIVFVIRNNSTTGGTVATATAAGQVPVSPAEPTATVETALPSPSTATGGTAAPVVVGTIKIVSSLPRTGSSKGQTDAMVNAINQRLEQDNNQACNGQFKIAYEDMDDATAPAGKWDPTQEANNANKAAADADVMVYIGTFNSGAARVSIPILNAAGLVMISPSNTYPGLTKPGKGEAGEPDKFYPTGKRNYTRVVPADDIQGSAAANWAKDLGVKSVYILHDTETYSKGVADVFRAEAKELGFEEKGYEGIDTKAQDYKALGSKIKDAKPDLVYFGGITQNNVGQLLKDLRAAGYQGKFMGPDGIYEQAFLEAAGDSAEGAYLTFGAVPPTTLTGKGKEWYDAYKAKFNSEPEVYAQYAYEATSVALAAINKVCKKNRAAILDAVFATRDFDGVLGKWSFDANGDTTLTDMSGVQVKNGKFDTENIVVLK